MDSREADIEHRGRFPWRLRGEQGWHASRRIARSKWRLNRGEAKSSIERSAVQIPPGKPTKI